MKMFLRFLAISALVVGTVSSHEKCPSGQDWQSLKHACWRESRNAKDFKSAINFCIADDYHDGPGANLIPVEKLRHLVNPYHPHHDGHHVHFDKDHGPFHVNAVKAKDGLWREYPGGRIVNFHHFPHFDALEGREGDTLHWHPEQNQLRISDKDDKFHVICYRPKRDPECRLLCPGYSVNQECYNAGDCYHGECVCDRKFSGKMCQFKEREDAKLFVVGVSANNATNVELVDLESRESCLAAPLPGISGIYGGLQGAYFDHKVHVCSGATPNCYAYERDGSHESHESHEHNWAWNPIGPLHTTRTQGASVLIPLHEHDLRYPVVRGLNYGWREHLSWWYSGGIAIYPNSTTLESSEILKSDKNWRYAPELPYVDGLNYHCKVQISDCETAVIGGFSQINLTIPTNVMTISNAVYVYNWKTEEWRHELDLPLNNKTDPACARIKDPYTDRTWILIAGGFNPILIQNTNQVLLWDPENNEVQPGPPIPFNNDGMHIVEYTETEVLMAGGFRGNQTILSFSFENGWQTWGSTRVTNSLGAFVMVPKHFGSCIQATTASSN